MQLINLKENNMPSYDKNAISNDCSIEFHDLSILLDEDWLEVLLRKPIRHADIKVFLKCLLHYVETKSLLEQNLGWHLNKLVPEFLEKFINEENLGKNQLSIDNFSLFLNLLLKLSSKFHITDSEIQTISFTLSKILGTEKNGHIEMLVENFSSLIKVKIDSESASIHNIQNALFMLSDSCMEANCDINTITQLSYLLGLINSKLKDKKAQAQVEEKLLQLLRNSNLSQQEATIACHTAKLDSDICQSFENSTQITAADNTTQVENVSTLPPPLASTDLSSLLPYYGNTNQTTNAVTAPITTLVPSLTTNNTTIEVFTNTTPEFFPKPAVIIENSVLAKLPAAIGAGIVSGCLELPSDIVLHIAIRKGCSEATLNRIRFVLTFTTSFARASLPMLYSLLLDALDDETGLLTISQKIISTTTIFLLNVILQGIAYYSESKLSKDSMPKFAIKFLPLLAIAGMVINVDQGLETTLEKIQEALILFGVSFLGAAIPKTLVNTFIFFCNHSKDRKIRLASASSYKNYEEGQELLPFDTDSASSASNKSSRSSNTSIDKQLYFIKEEKLEEIKSWLNSILTNLANLSSSFKAKNEVMILAKQAMDSLVFDDLMKKNNSTIKLIQESEDQLKSHIELLNDEHKTACIPFNSPSELLANSSVTSLHALLKAIKDKLTTVNSNLDRINGVDNPCPDIQKQLLETRSYLKSTVNFIEVIFKSFDSNQQGVNAVKSLEIKALISPPTHFKPDSIRRKSVAMFKFNEKQIAAIKMA